MSDFHEPMSRYEDQGNYDSYSSHVSDVGDNRVRYFVALFDYDPQTMSPNPDAADEELPFQEGQMIKIYGDKDADGFYRGESNGRVGLVPGNMVSEVQVDVDPVYYNDNSSRPRSLGQIAMDERDADWQSRRIKKMVAIYDYDPQEISPNVDAEMELSFSVGDVIYVIGDVDEDGFYMGELNGVKGLVPSNFLREVPIEEDEKRRASSRPKGIPREDYQHAKNAAEQVDHRREHPRSSEKPHYTTNAGHKGAPTSSGYAPPSNLWDESEFERESTSRGPHVPPRGQRISHQTAFAGPTPPDQHW
ncbi:RIMS-binding protein 2, partial [Stegodyphus mimosarum]